MSLFKFAIIIMLCKLFAIAAYSIGAMAVFHRIPTPVSG